MLAGCSSSHSTTHPASAAVSRASAATQGPDVSIAVTISHGTVTPPDTVHRVKLGQRVEIVVTSDVAQEVHLHGYDKELELAPGVPGRIDFAASIPGIVEFESQSTGAQLLQIEAK